MDGFFCLLLFLSCRMLKRSSTVSSFSLPLLSIWQHRRFHQEHLGYRLNLLKWKFVIYLRWAPPRWLPPGHRPSAVEASHPPAPCGTVDHPPSLGWPRPRTPHPPGYPPLCLHTFYRTPERQEDCGDEIFAEVREIVQLKFEENIYSFKTSFYNCVKWNYKYIFTNQITINKIFFVQIEYNP